MITINLIFSQSLLLSKALVVIRLTEEKLMAQEKRRISADIDELWRGALQRRAFGRTGGWYEKLVRSATLLDAQVALYVSTQYCEKYCAMLWIRNRIASPPHETRGGQEAGSAIAPRRFIGGDNYQRLFRR